jgi:peroxiredoxin
MGKFIYLFLAAAIMAACTSTPEKPHYNITGKITGADSVTFILQMSVNGKNVKLDSASVVNGKFQIKGGAVDFPESASLVAKGKRGGISFYLENSDITITGNIDSLYYAKVTGSKTQDDYYAFRKSLEPINEKNKALNAEYKAASDAGDKAKKAELEKKFDENYAEQITIEKEFVKNHTSSYFSPSLLNSLSGELESGELESLINALDTNVARVATITDLKERVTLMKAVAIGQKAPDFTLNDVNDKPVALSLKIGKSKLLLVDFWASWCEPCRNENPFVVKVWKEFNKKGFDIFSVSLDRPGEKDKWIQAIKNDNLTWTHVSDLQYWDCAAAKLYVVRGIPANFLLDANGTIVAKNLREEKLYDKVKELLTAKK